MAKEVFSIRVIESVYAFHQRVIFASVMGFRNLQSRQSVLYDEQCLHAIDPRVIYAKVRYCVKQKSAVANKVRLRLSKSIPLITFIKPGVRFQKLQQNIIVNSLPHFFWD